MLQENSLYAYQEIKYCIRKFFKISNQTAVAQPQALMASYNMVGDQEPLRETTGKHGQTDTAQVVSYTSETPTTIGE